MEFTLEQIWKCIFGFRSGTRSEYKLNIYFIYLIRNAINFHSHLKNISYHHLYLIYPILEMIAARKKFTIIISNAYTYIVSLTLPTILSLLHNGRFDLPIEGDFPRGLFIVSGYRNTWPNALRNWRRII